MQTAPYWKKPIYSAIVFFGTLLVLSVGYAAYQTISSSEYASGQTITSSLFEKMVGNLADHESRINSLSGTVSAIRLPSLIAWSPNDNSTPAISWQTNWTGFCSSSTLSIPATGKYLVHSMFEEGGGSCMHASCRLAVDGVVMNTPTDTWNSITSWTSNYNHIDSTGYITLSSGSHTAQMQCIFHPACTGTVECYRVWAILTGPYN